MSNSSQQQGFGVWIARALVGAAGSWLCFYYYDLLPTSIYFARKERKRIQQEYGEDVVEPPRVRSWIPYLGLAPEMGHDIRGFIQKYCQRCGNVPVFSCTIAGRLCHFIGDSTHASVVYDASPKKLDGDAMKKFFMLKAFGVPMEVSDKVYGNDRVQKLRHANSQSLLRKETLQKTVQKAQKSILRVFEKDLDMDGWVEVPLFEFVFQSIYVATFSAFVSEAMANKELIPYFRSFDLGLPKAMKGMPQFLLKDYIEGRDKMLEIIRSPKHQETMLEFFRELKRIDVECGVPRSGSDPNLLAHAWATVGSTAPSVFWLLAYMLHDETFLQEALKEVRSVVDGTSSHSAPSAFSLEQLDKLEVIDSAFKEVLRMVGTAMTPRDVKEDIILERSTPSQKYRYLLKKGTRIFGSMTALHMDPDIYKDPENFHWDRFRKDPITGDPPVFTKNGKQIDAWRAFGGGKQHCPGRKFATYEAKAYAALFLSTLEIRLKQGGQAVPVINLKKANVPVISPEHDVVVEIRRRK
jgi:hypothetical protein